MVQLPTQAPQFPRSGNAFSRWLGRSVLRLFGWRVEATLPDIARGVIVLAPHTSNWDFVFGMAAILALGIRVRFFGKHTLFRGPFGWLMRLLGGLPVDRSAPGGVVGATTAAFAAHPQLIVALAPEGTRKRVERWKSGWHQMAHGAGVPVLPAYVDFPRKVVGLLPTFKTTDDYAADLAHLQSLYRLEMARWPQKFNLGGAR